MCFRHYEGGGGLHKVSTSLKEGLGGGRGTKTFTLFRGGGGGGGGNGAYRFLLDFPKL